MAIYIDDGTNNINEGTKLDILRFMTAFGIHF